MSGLSQDDVIDDDGVGFPVFLLEVQEDDGWDASPMADPRVVLLGADVRGSPSQRHWYLAYVGHIIHGERSVSCS